MEPSDAQYLVGWARADLGIAARGLAMNGYGMWSHRASGSRTPLFARTLYVEPIEGGTPVVLCLLDLAMVTHAIRASVLDGLESELGAQFSADALVLSCTHTHSGPGGCGWEALYNVVTPGFVPEHLEAVTRACVDSVLRARELAAPTQLGLVSGEFDPDVDVAWNRSLTAYNRNSGTTPRGPGETHLALNRTMDIVTARRDGELRAFLSLFGVHATCLGNTRDEYDGDNKGYAAAHAEACLDAPDDTAPVALFAQSTAGDVSPHYHGPGDKVRRAKLSGSAEVAYARRNGELQSEHAMALAASQPATPVSGPLDAVLTYLDFEHQSADPEFTGGHGQAETTEACHGVAFFRGTPIDGPGIPALLGTLARGISRIVRRWRSGSHSGLSDSEREAYLRMYRAQWPKDILLESSAKRILGWPLDRIPIPGFADPTIRELKRQARLGALDTSALVPTVLPIQIVRLGSLALVCCPGEFTTVAGERVLSAVREPLESAGVTDVFLCTYCNDYMGYVTTHEEYEQQNYEGGHTIFGRWTLAAFQSRFRDLARELGVPEHERSHDRTTRPAPPVESELALRSLGGNLEGSTPGPP